MYLLATYSTIPLQQLLLNKNGCHNKPQTHTTNKILQGTIQTIISRPFMSEIVYCIYLHIRHSPENSEKNHTL